MFRKPAKISIGYAKYMTNQIGYITVMPEIFYYQFVVSESRLSLVYSIPMLSI